MEEAAESFPAIPITPPQSFDGVTRPAGIRKILQEEWAPALLVLICDIVCWITIYGLLSFVRRDQFFSSQFEYAIIDLIQLLIIIQALFVIGGYNTRTETRGLAYTAEHILAMICALVVSSLVLYVAAMYDQSMKPSRGAILLSFVAFTPVSILYRRGLRNRVTAAAANRAYLVIGAGELAAKFYEAYRASGDAQRLEFVALDATRIGQRIAGPESPIAEGKSCRQTEQRFGALQRNHSGGANRKNSAGSPGTFGPDPIPTDPRLHDGIILRSALAASAGAVDRSVLAVADRIPTFAHLALSLLETPFRHHRRRRASDHLLAAHCRSDFVNLANERSAGNFPPAPDRPRWHPVHRL